MLANEEDTAIYVVLQLTKIIFIYLSSLKYETLLIAHLYKFMKVDDRLPHTAKNEIKGHKRVSA